MASRTEHYAAGDPEPLHPAALLAAWEEGCDQGRVERALTLLGRGLPAANRELLADLPIGRRDALLLRLRERSFGPVADCVVRCAECQETMAFPVRLRALVTEAQAESEGVVGWQDLRLRVRPATTRDLLALAGLADPAAMVDVLLQRCATVVDAHEGAIATPVPAAAAEVVSAEMARLDPGADLRLDLSCSACGAGWTSVFDVGSYLWSEVDTAARRLLGEVHALARAYGWTESETLELTPARRRAYLELAGAS